MSRLRSGNDASVTRASLAGCTAPQGSAHPGMVPITPCSSQDLELVCRVLLKCHAAAPECLLSGNRAAAASAAAALLLFLHGRLAKQNRPPRLQNVFRLAWKR